MELDRITRDVDTVSKFYGDSMLSDWWTAYIAELKDAEDQDSQYRDVISELRQKKNIPDLGKPNSVELDIGIPNIHEPIPPVIIGSNVREKSSSSTKELKVGDMVLTDSLLHHIDSWPQVAKVTDIATEDITVQWFWGSKTTSWTPATKPMKGVKGKREPDIATLKRQVIWYHGFSLTPQGFLPRAVREAIDNYNAD